mgnify:CR=1 FL=1
MDIQQLQGLVPEPGQHFDAQACLEAIPALLRLASTPQDPYYHAEGDVWIPVSYTHLTLPTKA